MAIRPLEPSKEPVNVVLPATPSALRQARREIRQLEELQGLPDIRATAELLASELAANVMRHSGIEPGATFLVTIECNQETLHVAVSDEGTGFDPLALLRIHSANNAHHRGIFIVHALADRWGFRRDNGCHIWFEIDLVPGRRPWRGREKIRFNAVKTTDPS